MDFVSTRKRQSPFFTPLKKFAVLAAVGVSLLAPAAKPAIAQTADDQLINYSDLFHLEYAANPVVSPDGKMVVYERRSNDIHTDRTRRNLWQIDLESGAHTPLLTGEVSYFAPSFSPDGRRLAYMSTEEGKAQLYVRWLETGQTARLTDLDRAPSNITWSPDGTMLAMTLFVPEPKKPLFEPSGKPKGATWAAPAKVIDRTTYRADGAGYLPEGHGQIAILPATGGTPRLLTTGPQSIRGRLAFDATGDNIFFSAVRGADWQQNSRRVDIFKLTVADKSISRITSAPGAETLVAINKDHSKLAYLHSVDARVSYTAASLAVIGTDGGGAQDLTDPAQISVGGRVYFADNSNGLYYSYDQKGKSVVAYVSMAGASRGITDQVGGTTLGRPYTSGDFALVARGDNAGDIVFTLSNTQKPADLAITNRLGQVRQLTDLNTDLLGHKKLAKVEELNIKSRLDGLDLQAWVAYPPNFDASQKYPLLLEIHGGPHTAYGPQFSSEIQMYAAEGYVVVYGNPRGSTSYGTAFANEISMNYPNEDYNDLMDMVQATVDMGFIDEDKLYVTGGSGGGVLTAWIVGKTPKFRAAVVAKPVINWASFVLTADGSPFFMNYWFPTTPWEDPMHYWKRSPLSLVGNVTTPTMLLTGEVDYRTPMSETEQYYQALKLRGVDTTMVRLQGASHGIAGKPSNLARKIGNILAWFKRYDGPSRADKK